ncbi:MAG: glycoside hydrolase family 2 protein, partial [Aristaeellaceae bacterium]
SFDMLLYTSQILQAQAIQYGVEHWRRHRECCAGAIVWQLNDCWPVASWASIDYYGRWKALHYAQKRFFAPVLLSCEEEGMLSQGVHVNTQPGPIRQSIRLNVSNESREAFDGTVSWTLRDAQGRVLREESMAVSVPPQTSCWLEKTDLSDMAVYEQYVAYELKDGSGVVSEGTTLLCPPKHFRFCDPGLSLRREGQRVIVSARAYAHYVEIVPEQGAAVLSDNFFDMNPGEKTVEILRGDAESFSVRSVWDI